MDSHRFGRRLALVAFTALTALVLSFFSTPGAFADNNLENGPLENSPSIGSTGAENQAHWGEQSRIRLTDIVAERGIEGSLIFTLAGENEIFGISANSGQQIGRTAIFPPRTGRWSIKILENGENILSLSGDLGSETVTYSNTSYDQSFLRVNPGSPSTVSLYKGSIVGYLKVSIDLENSEDSLYRASIKIGDNFSEVKEVKPQSGGLELSSSRTRLSLIVPYEVTVWDPEGEGIVKCSAKYDFLAGSSADAQTYIDKKEVNGASFSVRYDKDLLKFELPDEELTHVPVKGTQTENEGGIITTSVSSGPNEGSKAPKTSGSKEGNPLSFLENQSIFMILGTVLIAITLIVWLLARAIKTTAQS